MGSQQPSGSGHAPQWAQVAAPTKASLQLTLHLNANAPAHRDALGAIFLHAGWKVDWETPWSGIATKGNKTMNILFGALAQYHEVKFQIGANPDGSTTLMLYRSGSGCAGGLIGMAAVKSSFRNVGDMVQHHYAHTGALLGVQGR